MNKQKILGRLYSVRTKKRLSSEAMARALGCKRAEYAQKEKGRVPITTEEWLKISAALDLPVNTFFLNIPVNEAEEVKKLIHGYNRLSPRGKTSIMTLLNAFLQDQWSKFRDKSI